jgi:oxygen-independent coproporphyrinogen III oxidase
VSVVPSFDAAVLRRYDRPGPRYTSYPAAPQFTVEFGTRELRHHAAFSNAGSARRNLSLYVHVPYCLSPCFYCGCNRLITSDAGKGVRYTDRLLEEIELVAPLFDAQREVVQLHLGGGTPNFLGSSLLVRLIERLGRAFLLSGSAQRDFSIELDPRSVPADYPATLVDLGFNRVSLGVQDFDPAVQQAVNRLQSIEQTLDLIDECRDRGIRSVNVDLIYGLPRQTPAGFRRTLRTVVAARPDRLAVYGYAHLPGQFKAQRQIASEDLPNAEARLELLRIAIEELVASGYRYIGMDHFALPDDELSRAHEAGGLQRNFMGYTTHANCDLIGLGVSSISHVGNSFSQNFRDLKSWEGALEASRLPVWRGLALDRDDRVRGAVIAQLMCRGTVDVAAIERAHGIDFSDYFTDALERLKTPAADGLVEIRPGTIRVTSAGQLLLRSIAMCFDRYLKMPNTPGACTVTLSKVV